MSRAKVVSLDAYRSLKNAAKDDPGYELRIRNMTKLELLDEMVRFQEERADLGHLSLSLMMRGRVLFGALEKQSETRTLRALTRAYRRHLEYEIEQVLETPSAKTATAEGSGEKSS